MSIWLPISKSRELPWFICIQVAYNISFKRFRQVIQLCFQLHFHKRSAKKIMGFQSWRSINFKIFGTVNLRVSRQNKIWVQLSWLGTKNTIRGMVVASFKSELWCVLWVHVCPFIHQKCCNYTLTNLLFS
jgi:hypothetical protein